MFPLSVIRPDRTLLDWFNIVRLLDPEPPVITTVCIPGIHVK